MDPFLRLKGNGLAEAVMLKTIRALLSAQMANLNVPVFCQPGSMSVRPLTINCPAGIRTSPFASIFG